jgi:molecular chaperone HtpG
VSDSLGTLYRNERDKFISCWEDASWVVKLGILEDEKFYERVKEFLVWKNTDSNWTTVEEYLEHNRSKIGDKIMYSTDIKHAVHFIDIYKKQGIEVLCADSPIDAYVIQFLERHMSPLRFQRVDSSIDENLIDKSREKSILDESGKTEATHLADFIRDKLGDNTITVEAKSLVSESLPGFVIIDENQRRMRDYMMQIDPKEALNKMSQLKAHTFVVNTNNPLMHAIKKIDAIDPDLAKDIVVQAYELSLLSQREMDPSTLNSFVERNNRVLDKLAKIVEEKTP